MNSPDAGLEPGGGGEGTPHPARGNHQGGADGEGKVYNNLESLCFFLIFLINLKKGAKIRKRKNKNI